MSQLYTKGSNGSYVPVSFEKIISKDWGNKLIVVRVGNDNHPAEEKEIDSTLKALEAADALDDLENSSFLVTLHEVTFEVLGSVKDISNQCVAVRVTAGDDLSKLGDLQKNAKEQLRGKVKKVAILPAPLTVTEYKEVMDIKRRCDTRRSRRGR